MQMTQKKSPKQVALAIFVLLILLLLFPLMLIMLIAMAVVPFLIPILILPFLGMCFVVSIVIGWASKQKV